MQSAKSKYRLFSVSMIMRIAFVVTIFAISILILASVSSAITGLFYKTTTKTLYPGDAVEQNFTVRKFYNLTVKFQKFNSTSDLTIRNSNTTIIFKDESLKEVERIVGMNGNSIAMVIDKLQLEDKLKIKELENKNKRK